MTRPPVRHVHRSHRILRAGITLALVASTGVTLAAVGAMPAHAAPQASASGPLNVQQALTLAHSRNTSVVADAANTPTETLIANPDGSLTVTQTALPARKLVNRVWTKLDATLHANADGTVSPAVTTNSLTLSGGGNSPVAVMRTPGGQSLGLTLPMSLPAPTLSGATATYPGVLPGVDLEMTVDTQGGFREVLVVHDATAAANPQVQTLTMTTATTGVQVSADAAGNLSAVDTKGRAVFTAPAPVMWDSTANPAVPPTTRQPRISSAAGPGAAARVTPLRVAAGSGRITLTPDRSLLGNPATHYPLYIDPAWSSGKTGWASITKNFSTTYYWNKTPDLTPGQAQVGNSGSMWSHTLINFPVPSSLAGATISTAMFYITNSYSYSCTSSTVEVFAPSTTLTSGNARWSDWSGVDLGGPVATANVAYGYNSSCPAASVGFDVRSAVGAALAAGRTTQTLVMTGVNESSDTNSWKEFDINTATMTITYNHPPQQPTGLTTSPSTSCTASPPTAVGDADVTLYTPVYDPDGENNLSVSFQLQKTGTGTNLDASMVTYPSGTTAVHTVPRATLETAAAGAITEFSWQARVSDGALTSAWSTACNFRFDPTRTGQPAVAVPASITIGQPATFAVTPPPTGTTPTGYLYQLNGGAYGQVNATAGTASITISPTRHTNTLTVTSLSAGGNIGDTNAGTFNAVPSAIAQADQDLTGDNIPDLHLVGAGAIPAGLWTVQGQPITTGQLNATGHNIGINGNGEALDNSPADFTGAQITTGHYTGSGLQDVLAYYPNGMGIILNGNGDGSPLVPVSGAEYVMFSGTFTDNNADNPTQLVNAGNSSGQSPTYPDLIGTSGDAGIGYYLDYYLNSGGTGKYGMVDQLDATTPVGDMAWNNWTITTCQVNNQTDMYLWNKTTGALYLWTNLSHTPGGTDLGHVQYTVAASGWNTGASLSLQAADVNTDTTPDLWTTNATTGVISTYLLSNLTCATGTITTQPAQTFMPPANTWYLNDAASGTVTAHDSTSGLTATGSGHATWSTGELFSPDVALDGVDSVVSTPSAAVATAADFSVSVWARVDQAGGTVLSQDGAHTSAFKLWAEQSDRSWRFGLATSDVNGATYDVAAAPANSVAAGVWTNLTATYRRSSGKMELYVNSSGFGGTHTAAWASTGSFRIGDALTSGTRGGYFDGQVAGVQVWNQVTDFPVPPPPTTPFTDGTFITNSVTGEVYRIAGGAPLYVSTWAAVGGVQTTQTVDPSVIASLPQYPADGTYVQTGDTARTIYIFAGGAPIAVADWAHVGGTHTYVVVDPAAIANAGKGTPWNHARMMPADGTAVGVNTGVDGAGQYLIAGGAPVRVSDWAHVGGSRPFVTIDGTALTAAGTGGTWNHLRQVPADGTVIRGDGASNNNAVYIVAGGAPVYVVDWNHIGGPRPYVEVDGTAIENAGTGTVWNHLRQTPADGTVIQSFGTGAPAFHVVAGGAPLYLGSGQQACAGQPFVVVDGAAVDNAGTGTTWNHLSNHPADGTFVRDGNGTVYRVVGGGPIWVGSWTVYNPDGSALPTVAVEASTVDNAGTGGYFNHLSYYPADGTRVTGLPGGARYTITGGVPQAYTGTDTIPTTNGIDQTAIDRAGEPGPLSHLKSRSS